MLIDRTPHNFPIERLEPRRLFAGEFAHLGKTGTLTLIGTAGDDHFVITGLDPGQNEKVKVSHDGEVAIFAQRDVLRLSFDGGLGNDYVEVSPSAQAGSRSTLLGGEGNDTLIGGSLFDTIYGGVGADVLMGGNQRDVIYGEGGKDRIYGNGFGDTLVGGAGDDRINGGPGDDNIDAGSGRDTITSGGNDDTINGGAGIDTGLDLQNLMTPPISVEVL